jgi:hypothetical protein
MSTILVASKIATSSYKQVSVERVLSSSTNYYEVINPKINKYVKIYFDIDDEEHKIDEIDVINDLNDIFAVDVNQYAISTDIRESKKSIHITINGLKTQINDLLKLAKSDKFMSIVKKYGKNPNKIINKKTKKGSWKLDPSVYSNGDQKFRTLFSKKETDKTSNGLIPKNFTDNLSSHLISITNDDDTIWVFKNTDTQTTKKSEPFAFSNEQQIIINEYKIKGTPKSYSNYTIMDIDCACPFGENHNNNNRYLIITKKQIKLKCHSEKCKNKEKLIWCVKVDLPKGEFSVSKLVKLGKEKSQNIMEEMEKLQLNEEIKESARKIKMKKMIKELVKVNKASF